MMGAADGVGDVSIVDDSSHHGFELRGRFCRRYRHSANFVMKGCRLFASEKHNSDLFYQGYCMGLLVGLPYADPMICMPRATNYQTARVVVQYIDQQPARLHEDFIDLALEALRRAWPCKR